MPIWLLHWAANQACLNWPAEQNNGASCCSEGLMVPGFLLYFLTETGWELVHGLFLKGLGGSSPALCPREGRGQPGQTPKDWRSPHGCSMFPENPQNGPRSARPASSGLTWGQESTPCSTVAPGSGKTSALKQLQDVTGEAALWGPERPQELSSGGAGVEKRIGTPKGLGVVLATASPACCTM